MSAETSPHDSSPSSHPVYQYSEDLKGVEWPEENLTSTIDEGGGFYPVRLGETFDDGRFVITKKLGWGGFSSVWLARDRKENRHVALKILSSYASREIEAGRLRERDILRNVTSTAPYHRQHICFATDPFSLSVPDLKKELPDPRLPLKLVLRLTRDVLKGLEYLHDECKIIHSDLKPGNLLLLPSDIDRLVMRELAEQPSSLYEFPKTIPPNELPFHPVVSTPIFPGEYHGGDPDMHWVIGDLGHAHLQREHLSYIVQPYALRAPEVILGLEWGPAIDIWSLGCMMYEFATANWLFAPEATDDLSREVVHLAQMTQRTGQNHDEAVLKQYEIRWNQHDLKDKLRRASTGNTVLGSIESKINESTVYNNGTEEVTAFIRVMRSLLILDPAKRPRAVEALRDPVFEHV